MNSDFIEQLLYEEEGPTLDFKRDQYAFAKATEEEKSELLKDIIGFVNCWRRGEAFILIGVQEVQGGKSTVHGISDHLADHSLQQFVNNLTNRPVQFGYEACECDGKQVGIIRIEMQKRPVFLKRDYGKLKKGEVYVRRGSSTDPSKPADPDEIALMGSGQAVEAKAASLSVEFAAIGLEQSLGTQIEWTAENCEMPDSNDIPLLDDRPHSVRIPGGGSIQMPNMSSLDSMYRLNETYYHDLAYYEFIRRLVKEVRLVVINTGDAPATDVRLEIAAPVGQGFNIADVSELPDVPERRTCLLSSPAMKNLHLRHVGHVAVNKNDQQMKVEIDCGNLQPGRKVWTDSFRLGIGQSGEVELKGHVFAANLTKPQEFSLKIKADIQRTSMTLDELFALDKEDDEE
ncbi:helix-turn-helix domain-containing protein [Rosistilla oblonga]|uniref:Divergent AAA domain protein n=1 Tax=Rosistilla oblonga TaxID=2527990 RepID=A0A518IT38_9BACT|nr:ATP-binding protein [Rosistilla oblonga]QDV56255.1 Divergent AAA domain protein [Rosistilla oblonga]